MAKIIHIAIFSLPTYSHQASIIEFCKKLLHLHQQFHVTCIFPTISSPIPATVILLKSLPSTANCIYLPPVNEEDLPKDAPLAMQVQHAVSQSLSSFRDTLSSLHATTPLAALVTDVFANEALEIAKEFNLLSYIYFTTSTMTLSLLLQFPTLHEKVSGEYPDHIESIQIPGCMPIRGHDLPDDFHDRSSVVYKLILQRSKRLSLADGFLVNSFYEMEEDIVRSLQEHSGSSKNNAPIYLVGPIIQTGSSNMSNISQCLSWLENQRPQSVLYVSFGSLCSLSQQQLNELALGLELSGQKFLWVLRAPSDSTNPTFVGARNDDPLQFLPHGFLERTKEQGLVIPYWAPQTQILSNISTGGFITHCGWNSTLESIVMGVPMITWPLCADQKMNAILLAEGLKVALRPEFNKNDGTVEKEEIAKVIKGLILGDERNEIRQRIEKLKDAAANAFKEHGSSTRELFQFGTQMENLFLREPFK
ncbi:hydroquinone glucosyltransferase-like [Abrus precatorius]|uniref:Glycosyltransferase n=1 Tax=Abrus precatorius TaxID=3816 RepID=A0A8B8L6Z8_ABRPR|nr:hydroquinone glucosyltransferase-like [Abrus precatorius]